MTEVDTTKEALKLPKHDEDKHDNETHQGYLGDGVITDEDAFHNSIIQGQ